MPWVERASFTKIRRLLEISEQERNHEVLLTVKNLHDLSCHPSPYNVLIILSPLLSEIVEGEHFVVVGLLSLIPGGSSPTKEAEKEVAGRELVISMQPAQSSFASKDSDPASQASRQGEGSGRLERPPLARKDSHLAPRASKKRRRVDRKLLEQGWRTSFPGSLQYPTVPRTGKRKKRKRTICPGWFKILLLGRRREMLTLSKRLLPPPKWSEDLASLAWMGVLRYMPLSSRVCLRWV